MMSFWFVMVVFVVGMMFGAAIGFKIMANALVWYMERNLTLSEIQTVHEIWEKVKSRKGLRREK